MLPDKSKFGYTIRLVSEILESNGSSSMATVCSGTMALLDAGVPLAQPVAGIAMGLIKEDDRYAILSDILGDEDHLGDMDFKVCGGQDGGTSRATGRRQHDAFRVGRPATRDRSSEHVRPARLVRSCARRDSS